VREDQASLTAERVAERRAAHQLLDSPLIFDDSLALRIVSAQAAEVLRHDPASYDRSQVSRQLRTFLAIRSRFAEDELHVAAEHGLGQYVVLGAGFDTFAYRNPHAALRVFEVDHPATQHLKRTRLADANVAIPPTLVFAPADLSRVSIVEALAPVGFDPTRPVLVAWLGVVPYLTRSEVVATLRGLSSFAGGTTVIFDYSVPPASLGPAARAAFDAIERRVAAAGEPFKTFFEPAELRALLVETGFGQVRDLGPDDLYARYCAGRADGLRPGSAGHLVRASNANAGE
jgi:methyltransferase (TIGR00027 family)